MQRYRQTFQTTRNGTVVLFPSPTITVYMAGTDTLATLYSDDEGTPLGNPFTGSVTGFASFYAADGRYDVVATKSGYAAVHDDDVLLENQTALADALGADSGAGEVWSVADLDDAEARSLQDVARDIVSIKSYVTPGTADDTAGWNKLIDVINNRAAALAVFVPALLFTITGSLDTISAVESPTFYANDATLDIKSASGTGLTFYNPGDPVKYPTVSGMTFTSSVARSGGYALKFLNVENPRLNDVLVEKQLLGVDLATYQYLHSVGCDFRNNAKSISANFGDGLFITDARFWRDDDTEPVPDTIGIDIVQGGGFQFVNIDLTRLEVGINSVPASGQRVGYIFMSNVSSDSCGIALNLDATNCGVAGGIYHVQADTSCWFNSNTINGVSLKYVKLATFCGGSIALNGEAGGVIDHCSNVKFLGTTVAFNNVNDGDGVGGLQFTNSTDWQVELCPIRNDAAYYPIGEYNQKHGVKVGSGNDRYRIVGNTFAGHADGDIDISTNPATWADIHGNRTDVSNVIASDTTITVPIVHDEIYLTGSTTVVNIVIPKIQGKKLQITTEGPISITSTFNFKLAGGATFAGTADSTLSLKVNRAGTYLCETARAVL